MNKEAIEKAIKKEITIMRNKKAINENKKSTKAISERNKLHESNIRMKTYINESA